MYAKCPVKPYPEIIARLPIAYLLFCHSAHILIYLASLVEENCFWSGLLTFSSVIGAANSQLFEDTDQIN